MIPKIIPILLVALTLLSCDNKETENVKPIIMLINGDFTADGSRIPVGGKLSFGITAVEGSAPLTNIRIFRKINDQIITELDKGIFIEEGGYFEEFNAVKSLAEIEEWEFMVMNANRDSAKTTLTVLLGDGSAYGPINHYPSIKLGMQQNNEFPHFLDLHTGQAYNSETVQGAESIIDLVGFVYETSGTMSPTLCCPAYSGSSSVTGHYPLIESWTTRNLTLYDYESADNDLIDSAQFNAAINDSLLVSSFLPGSTSGLCKYCYTNRIIPFKTSDGKYGMVKIKHSDIVQTGYMELEIKIQQ